MSPPRRNWNMDDPPSLSPTLRLPSEEQWSRYRRDVLGYPRSLYDRWFSANLAVIRAGTVQLESPPRPSEVHCRLYVTCTEAPPNGTCFIDPATFTLFLSVEIPSHVPLPKGAHQSPTAVVEQFTGVCGEMKAPDRVLEWESASTVHEIRQERGRIASLFMDLALRRCNLTRPGMSVAMIDRARAASVGTPEEEFIDCRAKRAREHAGVARSDSDYNGTGDKVFGGNFEYTEADFGPEDFM